MPPDKMRQNQSVHRAGHVHIGKDDMHADRLTFQNSEPLIGMARFDYLKICRLQGADHRKADHYLVFHDDNDDKRGAATLGPWK
jgi:hypothetical protein